MKKRDAVIIGAGHNGLISAFYLARAGLSVEVVEALGTVGGACKTEELIPGYRFSTCANVAVWLRSRVVTDTGILNRGVEIGGASPDTRILEGNRPFVWWPDQRQLDEEIGRFSPGDRDGFAAWQRVWREAAELIGPYLLSYPPTPGQLFERACELGCEQLLTTLMTTSLGELADRFFESQEMRSSLSSPHDMGSLWDHGSGFAMALAKAAESYSETGEAVPQGYVKGGMGEITRALRDAAEEAGATITLNAPVASIELEAGRAAGVRLENGDQITAGAVISNTDPKRTFLNLIDAENLSAEFIKRVRNLRTDVAPLKFHVALSELPEYLAFPDSDIASRGGLVINPSREYHERAWDDARHGRLPEAPFMALMTPSLWDKTVAPPGHHTVSFWILFAPVTLAEGTWPHRREEMAERLLGLIDRYSPNFRRAVVDRFLLTPADLEDRVLLTDGNIHHVDIRPSQMLSQRPLPELAHYRAPLEGLYLCGAGQHPYGEVSGGPGHNAAHAVMEDLEMIAPGEWQQVHRGETGRVVRGRFGGRGR
jgi:phytoene dehydrogenase-like protein